jgi:hypothetical protein
MLPFWLPFDVKELSCWRDGHAMEKGAGVIRTLIYLVILLYQFKLRVRTRFPILFCLPIHWLREKIVKTGA